MTTWQNYMEGKDPAYHTISGALRVATGVYSPQLDNRRDLLVYLPPSHNTNQRAYPVIYMHDGQNLFDNATSYVGEWQVDETMERLAYEGIEAIVVGILNTGKDRIEEYSPFDNRWGKGRGDEYLKFIIETVKPLIDRSFHTLPDRAHTGIAGSSMGGLISMYGYFRYPEVFGIAGVMSPSFWLAGQALNDFIQRAPYSPGRLYLDIGTQEISWKRGSGKEYTNSVRRMVDLLVSRGYKRDEQVMYVE
ncbi:MAG TPA: alpha/beta hydrolase-fold protein, partial [Phototrophicaceae bacterium]|nr:alpha/beta hydrolase-fold protein [Phototrophicaceae bacterium]